MKVYYVWVRTKYSAGSHLAGRYTTSRAAHAAARLVPEYVDHEVTVVHVVKVPS